MDRNPLAGKKRKNPPGHAPQQPTPKKSKRDDKPHVLDDAQLRSSEFRQVEASLDITLPPMFIGDPRSGIQDMLDSMLMQYIPALQGVVLSHSNFEFTSDTALILPGSPFARCSITFKTLVWSPRVGMKLKGRINLSSPDHVSLLVHRTFNVSIPRQHLPFREYEFEYGPAENDPEFGVRTDGETSLPEPKVAEEERGVRDPGRWVHRRAGVPLGGAERRLEFTIIGLTIANGMLSLVGSTLLDPFTLHVDQALPQPVNPKARRKRDGTGVNLQGEDDDSDVESNPELGRDVIATLGERTDRLGEMRTDAEMDMGPTADEARIQSDKNVTKAERKRKREEKAKMKETAIEGSPTKKRKKGTTQS